MLVCNTVSEALIPFCVQAFLAGNQDSRSRDHPKQAAFRQRLGVLVVLCSVEQLHRLQTSTI